MNRILPIIAFALVALALGAAAQAAAVQNPIEAKDFTAVVEAIAEWAVAISIPLTALMVVYAGYLYLFGGASTENVERGRKALTWAAVGFIVVLVSGSVAALIRNVLQGK